MAMREKFKLKIETTSEGCFKWFLLNEKLEINSARTFKSRVWCFNNLNYFVKKLKVKVEY